MLTSGFLGDRRGNIAMMTALLAPLLLTATGAAIDFSRWTIQRTNLKEVADLLATRGAREFLLANASESNITAVINAAIANNVGDSYDLGAFVHQVNVDVNETTVSVTLTQPSKPGLILTKFYPYSENVTMTSTAVARGGSNVCVVALDDDDKGAITAIDNSQLNAPECAIYSNSVDNKGIDVKGIATLTSSFTCSAGGYGGASLSYAPMPLTDCPKYLDPLASRETPSVGTCDYHDTEIGDNIAELKLKGNLNADLNQLKKKSKISVDTIIDPEPETLSPGVYCGGLAIGTNADVTLSPGIYVIKDGPLVVGLYGALSGEDVSFYFVGDESIFHFDFESKISLSASETGALAGILFFEDRNAPLDRIHRILSDDARELIGTIYLSRGEFRIASLLPVADKSAYTAIVANKISLAGSPTLVLNSDYDATPVPVPAGVGPVGGSTYLRE